MERYRLGPTGNILVEKITSAHNVFIQIVTRLLEERECPEWETLGRTVLIRKKEKTFEKAEHFRLITCLSVIYNGKRGQTRVLT